MQRLLPPLLALGLVVLMVIGTLVVPIVDLIGWPWRFLGFIPLFIGIALLLHGSQLFTRANTNIKTFNDPNTLVESGAFAWTRNPMYLGFTLALVGIAIVLGSLSAWVGPIVFWICADRWYIPFEEARLTEAFGDRYVSYQSRVPRWLGPVKKVAGAQP